MKGVAMNFMINFLLLSVIFSYGNGDNCPQQCFCIGGIVNCNLKIEKCELSQFFNETSKNLLTLQLTYQNYVSFNICQLKKFTNLTMLNLAFDNLVSFPDKLDKCLPSLRTIQLQNNKFSIITEQNLTSYGNIKSMKLFGNKFNKLRRNIFSQMTNLEELYLSSCQVKQIEPNTFNNLSNLSVLDLSDNQIVNISNKLFPKLKNLKQLQLQQNKIRFIEDTSFQNLSIVTLDLRHNDIEVIPPYAFKNSTIQKLRLYGNPLHCECLALYGISQAVGKYTIEGSCSTPLELKGKKLKNVIEYEKNICNKNRICNGENFNIFNNSTFTYEQLCEDSNKEPKWLNERNSSKWLYAVIASISALLIFSISLVAFLYFRLRKLRKHVELEVMEELKDLPFDHDIRPRAHTTVLGNGDVLYVESDVNTKKEHQRKGSITLTMLKTPCLQQKLFKFDPQSSIENDESAKVKIQRCNTTAFEFSHKRRANGIHSNSLMPNGSQHRLTNGVQIHNINGKANNQNVTNNLKLDENQNASHDNVAFEI